MNIVQDFIAVGRKNRPGYSMIPKFITIHDTGSPGAGGNAAAHNRYIKTDACANRPASWHFTVDDHSAYQHLPLNENGWHAGDGTTGIGNRQSIGVETCINSDGDYAKTLEITQWLVAKLLKENNIAIENVVQHNRWNGKECPKVIRTNQMWDNFIKGVKEKMSVGFETYIVETNDTLSKIGAKLNIPWLDIAGLNGMKTPYTIYKGQILKVKAVTTLPSSAEIEALKAQVASLQAIAIKEKANVVAIQGDLNKTQSELNAANSNLNKFRNYFKLQNELGGI